MHSRTDKLSSKQKLNDMFNTFRKIKSNKRLKSDSWKIALQTMSVHGWCNCSKNIPISIKPNNWYCSIWTQTTFKKSFKIRWKTSNIDSSRIFYMTANYQLIKTLQKSNVVLETLKIGINIMWRKCYRNK